MVALVPSHESLMGHLVLGQAGKIVRFRTIGRVCKGSGIVLVIKRRVLRSKLSEAVSTASTTGDDLGCRVRFPPSPLVSIILFLQGVNVRFKVLNANVSTCCVIY